MATIGTLHIRALDTAAWRGHQMTTWRLESYWPHLYHSTYTRCDTSVCVSSSPPHSTPHILGDAVAINCKEK